MGAFNNSPDAIKRLLLPSISGLLMLIATSIYAFVEVSHPLLRGEKR
jgi:hypothetical protein